MNRIAAHVLAAFVLASVAAVLMAAGVFAQENPGNHYGKCCNPGNHYGQMYNPGHHYGQLKHPKTPAPTPNPNPAPQPLTHPGNGGGSPLTASTPGLSDGGPASSIPVTVTLPVQDQTSGRLASSQVPGQALDWLILLILPALLAVWVIAAGGIARKAARRAALARAAVPAPNPA